MRGIKQVGHSTGPASWVLICAVEQGPTVMSCCHFLKSHNNYFFELEIYNWSLMRQRSIREWRYVQYVCPLFLACRWAQIPMDSMCGVHWDSEHKLSLLCLQLSGWGCWQLQGAMLSLRTRTCFEHRKNHNDVLRNTRPKEPSHILSFFLFSFFFNITFLD